MEIKNKNKGLQVRMSFKNGYGISAIRFPGSYGYKQELWEVAVLKGEDIAYDTKITNDVIGWCSDDDLAEIMNKVRNLKKA
jgi:hypothetical protein